MVDPDRGLDTELLELREIARFIARDASEMKETLLVAAAKGREAADAMLPVLEQLTDRLWERATGKRESCVGADFAKLDDLLRGYGALGNLCGERFQLIERSAAEIIRFLDARIIEASEEEGR
jgi:hypothetical protein